MFTYEEAWCPVCNAPTWHKHDLEAELVVCVACLNVRPMLHPFRLVRVEYGTPIRVTNPGQ